MNSAIRKAMYRSIITLVVGAAGTAAGCTDGPVPAKKCNYSISIAGMKSDTITVEGNSRLDLTADLNTCGDAAAALGYQFEWYYDQNGNGVLDGTEREPFGLASDLTIISCFNEIGSHLLELKAVPINTDSQTLSHSYTVEVTKPTVQSAAPSCVAEAIDLVREAGTIIQPKDYEPFVEAANCLRDYTDANVCNFEANYAAVVAMGINLGGTMTDRFENRSQMTPADVEAIFTDEVVPLLQRITVVQQKAGKDFAFLVNGKAEVEIFGDLPYLEGDESARLLLQGEHDMTDVYAFAAVLHFLKGGMEMLLAYDGVAEAMLQFPRLDQVDFTFGQKYFIQKAIDDPEFLTLGGPDGKDGSLRLLAARGEFMDGFMAFRKAVELVQAETDPQADDLLRYWDCGSDGICDCTLPENNFLVCPNNPYDYPGPDADGTESNGSYDVGEPVGSERLANPDYYDSQLPADLKRMVEQIDMVVENLRGPDALDLDKMANAPVAILMKGVLLPVPEIRLSEWFLSPSNPRDVMPLYLIRDVATLFDLESEPFDDVGLDGTANEDERTVAGRNPRAADGVKVGQKFDKLLNPDPFFDDLDPFCNPYCNWTDEVDNDGDGLVDRDDIFRQGSFEVVRDLGVENNLVFDFIDENGNLLHDSNETHEPFKDTGTVDLQGRTIGAGDGRWNRSDRGHTWPTGDNIGPRSYDRSDPANGVPLDRTNRASFYSQQNDASGLPEGIMYDGLIDNYYFFFQDPTFSGAFTFPDDIENIGGELLSENAKLMRFFNKALELVESFGIREGNAHPCGIPTGCQ